MEQLGTTGAKPFVQVKDHVLLPWASELETVDQTFRSILTPEQIQSIIATVPDEWLISDTDLDASDKRKVYEQFLKMRLENSITFINEAKNARQAFI